MTSKNPQQVKEVILLIENRHALPVRLIPAVTGGGFPPPTVASILAHREYRLPGGMERIFIPSFQVLPNGDYREIDPREWDNAVIDLQDLAESLDQRKALHREWRLTALKHLMNGVFVWLDDLKALYEKVFPARLRTLYYDDSIKDDLILHPSLSDEEASVVCMGFEQCLIAEQENRAFNENQPERAYQSMTDDDFQGLDRSKSQRRTVQATSTNKKRREEIEKLLKQFIDEIYRVGASENYHWASLDLNGNRKPLPFHKGVVYQAFLIRNPSVKIKFSSFEEHYLSSICKFSPGKKSKDIQMLIDLLAKVNRA